MTTSLAWVIRNWVLPMVRAWEFGYRAGIEDERRYPSTSLPDPRSDDPGSGRRAS